MTARRRAAALAMCALALLVAAAATLLYTSAPKPAAPLEKITIAVSSTPHAALLHLAAAKGFFAAEGLDATITPVSHGKAAIDLLAQGKADLAAAAEVPFVISVLNGESFAIAATVVSVSNEMAVVARRDRTIAAPRDLLGKKVGVTFGTSGEYFLWAFLIRHKLPPEQITLVDMPPGRMAQELARGSVDAVAAWQPIRFQAETTLGENAASLVEPDAYTVTHVVVAQREFLKTHRPTVEKLVRALLKAEAFNRSAPAQAMAVLAERLKIDARALQTGWDDLELRVDLLQSQLITLEDEARWAMARGYAPKGQVPDLLPSLYLDALNAVKPDRVTVVH
ncbi:MAG TPA: NrtA/SsuA/CpmA family ABC transporter substrate-binding protein [Burkholderiaceae bacterium]|nr:NrtA/SsuA/CpmA family ABC transporter substrate-binding protein [Burkholderiaceae bacterium]